MKDDLIKDPFLPFEVRNSKNLPYKLGASVRGRGPSTPGLDLEGISLENLPQGLDGGRCTTTSM